MSPLLVSPQVGKNDDLIYGMKDAAVDLIKNYARANNGSVPEVGGGNGAVAAEEGRGSWERRKLEGRGVKWSVAACEGRLDQESCQG